jgi:hypothetical protein
LQQEFADLNRDFAEAKKHYLSLEGKDFGLQLANELQHKQESERFTILDPARVPDVPDVNRKRQLLLFVSVPFCFLLSAGTVLFVERGVKGTIGTQDALQALLPVNVAVLGRIPMVARKWSLAAFLPRNGNGRNGARRRKGTALKNGTAEHGVKA